MANTSPQLATDPTPKDPNWPQSIGIPRQGPTPVHEATPSHATALKHSPPQDRNVEREADPGSCGRGSTKSTPGGRWAEGTCLVSSSVPGAEGHAYADGPLHHGVPHRRCTAVNHYARGCVRGVGGAGGMPRHRHGASARAVELQWASPQEHNGACCAPHRCTEPMPGP